MDEQTIYTDLKDVPCNEKNGNEGTYVCTRPKGREGDHWQVAILASWSNNA